MFKVWQQLKMYKNLLVSFWLITAICFFTCAVVSYKYFTTPHEEILSSQGKINSLFQLQSQLAQLNNNSTDAAIFDINNLILQSKLHDSSKLPLSKEVLLREKIDLLNALKMKFESTAEHQAKLSQDYGKKQYQLFLIGLFSFIFGVLLPLLIIQLMIKAGVFAKQKTEEHLKAWVVQWHRENKNFQEPFKSPEFWSRIAIISIEHFAPLIDHPAASYVGEISAEIKKEILNAPKEQDFPKQEAA